MALSTPCELSATSLSKHATDVNDDSINIKQEHIDLPNVFIKEELKEFELVKTHEGSLTFNPIEVYIKENSVLQDDLDAENSLLNSDNQPRVPSKSEKTATSFNCSILPQHSIKIVNDNSIPTLKKNFLRKPTQCSSCNKIFRKHSQLLIHSRVHTGEKPFKCQLCNTSFAWRAALRSHLLSHSGDKTHVCRFCNKGYTHKPTLIQHLRIHTGEKPFNCDICNKGFNRKGHLSTHIRTHTGDKPYTCEICCKSFTQKGVLNKHYLLHSGEKPYVCEVCGRGFSRKEHMNRHKAVHSVREDESLPLIEKVKKKESLKPELSSYPSKKVLCSFCNKSFAYKYYKSHLRLHSSTKEFCCEQCGQTFSLKSDLKRHLLVHTGEKPFSCDCCDKIFSRKSHLKRHYSVHLNNE